MGNDAIKYSNKAKSPRRLLSAIVLCGAMAFVALPRTAAQRIVEAADRTMTEEIKRIRAQLEVEAVDAAISAAEKLLRKKVTEADRKRLDEQYLTQFSSGESN